jgi:hypothetical protein
MAKQSCKNKGKQSQVIEVISLKNQFIEEYLGKSYTLQESEDLQNQYCKTCRYTPGSILCKTRRLDYTAPDRICVGS